MLWVLTKTYVQNSFTNCPSHGVATKRVEVCRTSMCSGDLLRGDHSSHWEPVAYAFGHCHNVRDNLVVLEAPEFVTCTSKTGLYLKKWKLALNKEWSDHKLSTIYVSFGYITILLSFVHILWTREVGIYKL